MDHPPGNGVGEDDNDPWIEETKQEQAAIEERLRSEEYKLWKKNSPYLYDLIISHVLEYSSLTCQWFYDIDRPKGADYTIQRLLLGTHTPPNEQNYLEVASVQLPRDSSLYDSRIHDGEKDVSANVYLSITNGYGFGEGENRINLVKSIPHSGEVNRARYMPQNHDIIATKSIDGDVYIFDLTQPSPEPGENISCTPFLKLKGHSEEGFGLSWNQYRQGHVLDTSIDTTIGYWDISGNTSKPALDSATEINTLHVFKGHESAVEDVEWHTHKSSIFGSVGADKRFMIWDTRNDREKPAYNIIAHEKAVNALAFNPHNEHVVATGSVDMNVSLWDLRNLKYKLHMMEYHKDEILCLKWAPFDETILASSSGDRRVCIWDLSRIGEDQTAEDAEEGPSELLFVHGGHTDRVRDFSWNPHTQWVIASVADDNIMQIWQPSNSIVTTEDLDP